MNRLVFSVLLTIVVGIGVSSAATPVEEAYSLQNYPQLAQAEALRKEKKYDEARALLLQVAEENAATTQGMIAKFRAAKCLFDKGNYESFSQESAQLLALYPNADEFSVTNTKFMLAKISYRNKDYEQAVVQLQEIADSNPNLIFPAQALQIQGDSLRRLHRYLEARQAYGRIETVYHTPLMATEAKHHAAHCRFEAEEYDLFIEEATTLLADNPPADSHPVQTTKFDLAQVAAKKGDAELTAEELQAFIAANPSFRQIDLAHHRLGKYLMAAADKYERLGDHARQQALTEQAKAVLDPLRISLEATITTDSTKAAAQNIRYLILDCYQYVHDYTGLKTAAESLISGFQPPSRNWAAGMLSLGIAKAYINPPDFSGALATLDTLRNSQVETGIHGEDYVALANQWRDAVDARQAAQKASTPGDGQTSQTINQGQ